jgi:hypothetical protein
LGSNRRYAISTQSAIRCLDLFPDIFEIVKTGSRKGPFNYSSQTVVCYLAEKIDEQKSIMFRHHLAKGITDFSAETHDLGLMGIDIIRDRALNEIDYGLRSHRTDQVNWIAEAWNAFYTNQPMDHVKSKRGAPFVRLEGFNHDELKTTLIRELGIQVNE